MKAFRITLGLSLASLVVHGFVPPSKSPQRIRCSLASSRRSFLVTGSAAVLSTAIAPQVSNAAAATDASALIQDLEASLKKLEPIPDLLQKQEWDAVRTILKTPPVNQLWNMGDAKNTLSLLAKATDEFELIEMKDELALSLQMTDQLTYDNVFVYFQPGSGKIKIKEPTELARKAMSQLSSAIELAKSAI